MRASGLLVKATAAATILLTTSVLSGGAPAQSPSETPPAAAAVQPGDIAVTGFSGTKLQLDRLPPGVDPIAKTVIDPDGSTLQILGGSSLTGPLTAQKQLAPTRLEFKARDVGHVFGLAFDDTPADGTPSPGLFAGATSAFGLRIVGPDNDGDGKPDRLEKGAPGATFMEGQFGGLPGAGPGSIWKVDRATGAVSLFADVGVGGVKNSGPGIGGLAFDPASRTLYASDLDTGLIHRLSIANGGTDQGQFDYGVTARPNLGKPAVKDDGKRLDITSPSFDPAQPATWGYTQRERRIDALAVHGGRLYFAVAEGPEIWSVGLETDGAFKPDARFEIAVDGEKPALITGLAFDGGGNMIVAQRGDVQNPRDYLSFAAAVPARVLRYRAEGPDDPATPGLWQKPPEEYAVGNADDNHSSSGGVALEYGFNTDGTLDTNTCSGTIVASADALGPARAVHGLQLNAAGLVRPANVPPNESAFVNWNPTLDDAKARGYTGGIAVLHTCAGGSGAGFPPVAGDDSGGGAGFPPLAGDEGGGGAGFPPVAGGGEGGGGTTFPPVEGGGGGTTPPVVEGGGGGKITSGPFTVEKTGVSKECNETDPCTFAIKVTNTTDAPVPGPITIEDTLSAGGTSLANAKLSGAPNAPWSCTAAAAKVSCTHPGPLQPNTPETLTLSFIPSPLGAATEVQNCATLGSAPGPQKAALPEPTGTDANGMKVSLLRTFESCSPSTGTCEWMLEISSTSDQPLIGNATATFTFTPSPNGPLKVGFLSHSGGLATCQPQGAQTVCTGPVNVIKRTTILTFKADPSKGDPGSFVTAAVQVSVGDKQGSASAALPLATGTLEPLPLPGKTNSGVDVQTVAPAGCAIGAACEWEMKATNPGTVALSGELITNFIAVLGVGSEVEGELLDRLELVSASPAGTTCSPDPGSPRVMKCSRAGVTIPPNETVSTKVMMRVVPVANARADFFAVSSQAGFASNPPKSGSSVIFVRAADAVGGGAPGGAAPGQAPIPGDGGGAQPADTSPPLQACAVIPVKKPTPSVAGPLSLTKIAKPPCTNNRVCAFEVVVENTGATEFTGTVEFDDTITGDGAIFGATTIAPPPPAPWSCPKTGQGFKCTANLTLGPKGAANAKTTVPLTMDLGPGIGAVKEAKNCATLKGAPAPSCATAPLAQVQPPPAPPPADPNGLVLTKRRAADKCSDLGGGCAFIVRITNSSQAEFNGPIEFTDIIKTADGQALANATLEAQPLLTLAEGAVAAMSCTKAGDTVTCGTGGANAKIPPGKFVDALLTMKPGPAGGAIAVRNCALLKSGGGQSCSSMSLVNGPLLRLTKFGGGDTCLPRCTFAVVIQNVGNADAKGAFKFKDTFTPVSSLGGFDVQPGTGECSRGGDEFFCVPMVNVLKPGELTTVGITVFGTAKAPEYKNCVDFVPQPQAPKELLVLDDKNDGRCVTVKDTSPQTPNLVIRKQAPNRKDGSSDGHCNLKSDCRFTITVTNTGLAPFTGPLRVTDTVSLGVPQFIGIGPGSPQSLPWKCDSVQNGVGAPIAQSSIKCELPPLPNGLAPGTTATLEVQVIPGATWKGSDRLKNCAEITSDGDIGANAQKQDCAEVILDPFNVKVAKTGDQSCPPGSNCTFKITLFNPGPIPHNALVTITDALSPRVSAQIVSINPPLPCATQPSSIPFSCTSPGPVRLDLDAPAGSEFGPREFTMVVKMPSDGSAETYRNCISVAADATSAGEEACHTVTTKPKALTVSKTATSASCDETTPCNFKVTVTNTGAEPVAGPIAIADLTRVGRTPLTQVKLVSASAPWTCIASAAPGMQCSHPGPLPPNSTLNLDLSLQPLPGSLAGASEVRNCAGLAGSSTAEPGACVAIPVKATPTPPEAATCTGGMVMTARGCACPAPTKLKGSECVGAGGINTTPQTPPPAAPPPPVATSPAAPSCSGGMILIEGSCACPPAMKWNGRECVGTGGINTSTQPQTPPPAAPPPAPVVTSPAPPSCSGGMILIEGSCACPPAMKWNGRACVGTGGINTTPGPTPPVVTPPPVVTAPPASCTAGMILTAGGLCACPPAMKFSNGKCVGQGGINKIDPTVDEDSKQPRPQSPQCPDGFVGTPPKCCPRGTEFRDGACRGPQATPAVRNCPEGFVGTPPRCCPRGTQFRDGACRGPQATTPVEKTKPKVCPPNLPVGKFPNCCPINARFNGAQCRCLPGFEFRRGQCLPARPQPPTACPQGQIFINGQCRRLSIPTPQPQQPQPQGKCPPSAPEGTPPNCRCPAGTVSRDGFCRPANCPPNMTGTPPNCNRICPAGTVNRNQECVPVPQPGPVGPSPKPVPQKPQRTPCPPGWDGDFQPNCAKPPS